LTGKSEDIESLTSIRQVNELLKQMKNLFNKLKQDSKNLQMMEETVNSEKMGTADTGL